MTADERAWQQVLDAHAHTALDAAFQAGVEGLIVPSDPIGGRPTIEVCGPDGTWRRYYVRLTEVRG